MWRSKRPLYKVTAKLTFAQRPFVLQYGQENKMRTCTKTILLDEERDALLSGRQTAEVQNKLNEVHAAKMDHLKFWHPHNCAPACETFSLS
jgi:hypothetical protein